jgi:hypothetical protein
MVCSSSTPIVLISADVACSSAVVLEKLLMTWPFPSRKVSVILPSGFSFR